MKPSQLLITYTCPRSPDFQLVELKSRGMASFQIGLPVVSDCSVLESGAEDCGRCLSQPKP